MISIMKQIHLKYPDYIQVSTPNGLSYGGNQNWHSQAKKFGREARLSRFGCGTIALADVWLYLTKRFCKTELTAPVFLKDNILSQKSYMQYIRMINRHYTFTIPYSGVTAPAIQLAFNRYMHQYKLPLHAKYHCFMNNRNMLDIIIKSLQNDFPIILAIGPNFPCFWKKEGITFYKQENENDSSYTPCQRNVHSHYVTITGIYFPSNTSPMLEISSWGKRYFINFKEYRNYIKKYSCKITCGLLYIEHKNAENT